MSDAFLEIQKNPDICNNCFRRTHQRYERNYSVQVVQKDGEWQPVPLNVEDKEYPDEVLSVENSTTHVPLKPDGRGTMETCACGYPRGHKLRPLPKDAFVDYGENLFERLAENGYDLNRERFISILRNLKRNPKNQFADDRLYRKAVGRVL